MKQRIWKGLLLAIVSCLCIAAAYQPAPLPTPWTLDNVGASGSATITLANPSGFVRGIKLKIEAKLDEWQAKCENLGAGPGYFSSQGSFGATASAGGGNYAGAWETMAFRGTWLAAYDGTTDYAGTSGIVHSEFDDWFSGGDQTITDSATLSYINGGGRDLDIAWSSVMSCVYPSSYTASNDITDVDLRGTWEYLY